MIKILSVTMWPLFSTGFESRDLKAPNFSSLSPYQVWVHISIQNIWPLGHVITPVQWIMGQIYSVTSSIASFSKYNFWIYSNEMKYSEEYCLKPFAFKKGRCIFMWCCDVLKDHALACTWSMTCIIIVPCNYFVSHAHLLGICDIICRHSEQNFLLKNTLIAKLFPTTGQIAEFSHASLTLHKTT